MVWDRLVVQLRLAALAGLKLLMACRPRQDCDSVPAKPGRLLCSTRLKSSFWTSPCGISPYLSFLCGLISSLSSSISSLFFPESCFFAGRKLQFSCTYGSRFSRNTHRGADHALFFFCQTFRKKASTRQPQATSVFIFTGHCCCEFLRFLAFFSLVYKEILTHSLIRTQLVALIEDRNVPTAVIHGKCDNRPSCLVKTVPGSQIRFRITFRNCQNMKCRGNVVA